MATSPYPDPVKTDPQLLLRQAKEALRHSINVMSGVVMDNEYKAKSYQAALDAFHALNQA